MFLLIPVNRDRRPTRTQWCSLTLIVLNSISWVIPMLLGWNGRLIQEYGYRPGAHSFLTLFTSIFLHVGLLHVVGNMWFLWMFAPKVEERFGSLRFLIAYLACGVGGSGLHTLFFRDSLIPCVGASGAISGVAGMYFLLFPRSPFELILYFGWWLRKTFQSQTRGAVGVWIGEQLLLGMITASFGRVGGVAFWVHIGGFVCGVLCGALVLPKASAVEREEIFRPKPLTAEEKEKIFADYKEQPSKLTSLNLNSPKPLREQEQ